MIEHLFDTSQCGYNRKMTVATTLGIRELRDGLSRHIASVREGEEIIVTDHGKPVARITPYRPNLTQDILEELTRQGLSRPPLRPKQPRSLPRGDKVLVSDLIKEQRR